MSHPNGPHDVLSTLLTQAMPRKATAAPSYLKHDFDKTRATIIRHDALEVYSKFLKDEAQQSIERAPLSEKATTSELMNNYCHLIGHRFANDEVLLNILNNCLQYPHSYRARENIREIAQKLHSQDSLNNMVTQLIDNGELIKQPAILDAILTNQHANVATCDLVFGMPTEETVSDFINALRRNAPLQHAYTEAHRDLLTPPSPARISGETSDATPALRDRSGNWFAACFGACLQPATKD